jgi:transglutaminase-like putative cysteine protease
VPRKVKNIIAIWYFEQNSIYQYYGGTIKIILKNNGTQNIYVYEIGLKQKSGNRPFQTRETYTATTGKYVPPGTEVELGSVRFKTQQTSELDYNVVFSLYQQNETGAWNDCGNQEASTKTFTIDTPPGIVKYTEHYNLPQYYDKINEIVDIDSPKVINLSNRFKNEYPATFNIYQVCAVFDYVHTNIQYFSDPTGDSNYWCTPEQTLEFGGDCEDHATLVASILTSMGGAVRMYMTDSHAFAGLYVGNSTGVDSIVYGIQKYYRTNVTVFFFNDELGYWLLVDTIGSIYLGGLPLGAVPIIRNPVEGSAYPDQSVSWGFTGTENLFITDVIQ